MLPCTWVKIFYKTVLLVNEESHCGYTLVVVFSSETLNHDNIIAICVVDKPLVSSVG